MALCAIGFGLPACGGAEDDGIQELSGYALSMNALSMNALSMNALSMNALSMNALTMNALTMNALTMNALTMNALRDPLARQFMKYAVSCALPSDQALTVWVDGQKYSFPGQLGLAPEWAKTGGRCDGDCQRWVSACMLARVDYEGVERPVSLRGTHKALKTEPHEMRDYTFREAAYFGNVFVPGQPRFMCLPKGQTSNERVCGPSLQGCGIPNVGTCEEACDHEGPHRSYAECSTSGRADRPVVFDESVTVFLPKSAM